MAKKKNSAKTKFIAAGLITAVAGAGVVGGVYAFRDAQAKPVNQNTQQEQQGGTQQEDPAVLRTQLNKAIADLETAEGQILTLTEQKAAVETQLETAQGTVTTLTEQKTALETQLETAQGDKTALQEQLASVNESLQTAQGQVSTLTDQKSALETQLETANADKVSLQSQITAMQNQMETMFNVVYETLQSTGNMVEIGTGVYAAISYQFVNGGQNTKLCILDSVNKTVQTVSQYGNQKAAQVYLLDGTVFVVTVTDFNNYEATVNALHLVNNNGTYTLQEFTLPEGYVFAHQYSFINVRGNGEILLEEENPDPNLGYTQSFLYYYSNGTFVRGINLGILSAISVNGNMSLRNTMYYDQVNPNGSYADVMANPMYDFSDVEDADEIRLYNMDYYAVQAALRTGALGSEQYTLINDPSTQVSSGTVVLVFEEQETVDYHTEQIQSGNGYNFEYNIIDYSNTGSTGEVESGLKYVNPSDPTDVTVITNYGYNFTFHDLGNNKVLIGNKAVPSELSQHIQYTDAGLLLFDTSTKQTTVLINDNAKYRFDSPFFFATEANGDVIVIPVNNDYHTTGAPLGLSNVYRITEDNGAIVANVITTDASNIDLLYKNDMGVLIFKMGDYGDNLFIYDSATSLTTATQINLQNEIAPTAIWKDYFAAVEFDTQGNELGEGFYMMQNGSVVRVNDADINRWQFDCYGDYDFNYNFWFPNSTTETIGTIFSDLVEIDLDMYDVQIFDHGNVIVDTTDPSYDPDAQFVTLLQQCGGHVQMQATLKQQYQQPVVQNVSLTVQVDGTDIDTVSGANYDAVKDLSMEDIVTALYPSFDINHFTSIEIYNADDHNTLLISVTPATISNLGAGFMTYNTYNVIFNVLTQ